MRISRRPAERNAANTHNGVTPPKGGRVLHAAAGVNFENIVLSAIGQLQQDKCCMVPVNEVSKVVQFRDRK